MAPFPDHSQRKDILVSIKHTKVLCSWMRIAGEQNELIIVKDLPHFEVMFDADYIREKVIYFLKEELK